MRITGPITSIGETSLETPYPGRGSCNPHDPENLLGLDTLFAAMDALRAKLKHFDSRIWIFLDYGKTEIEQAKQRWELSKML